MKRSLLALLVATTVLAGDIPAKSQDDDAAAPKPAAGKESLERLIYVPYKDLKKALGSIDRTVFLPYSEYLELLDQVEAARRRAMEQPAAVLSTAIYDAKVSDDYVRITATFEMEAVDGPWSEVPVAFSGVTVGKITTPDGRPEVLLRGLGEGRYAFVLPDKGAHEVQVELLGKVRRSPDGRGFDLGIPSAGISTLEIEVPEADQVVRVEPDVVVLPADAEDEAKTTKVRADLGSATRLQARWSPRAGIEPDMELLATVDNAQQVLIADRLVNGRSVLAYRVLRGEQQQAKIALPKGHGVVNVSSPDVEIRGFATEEEGNRGVLTVDLLAPTRKPFTLEVRTEWPLPEDAFRAGGLAEDDTAYGIHALETRGERGQLVVVPDRGATLAIEETARIDRVEAADVPESLRLARGSYFRYFDPGFDLEVLSKPIEPRVVVTTLADIALMDDRIDTRTRYDVAIERTGVFEVAFEVPEGQEIVDVVCDRMRERTFDEPTRTLRVAFGDRFEGNTTIFVHTRSPFDATEKQDALKLAVPVPQGTSRETGRVDLRAIPGVAVRVDEAATTGLTSQPLAGVARRPDTLPISSWAFTKRPFEIVVGTLRRPTRLSAGIRTSLDVQRGTSRVVSRIEYLVEYAGLDEFRFAVPASVVDSVDVTDETGGPVDWKPAEAEKGWVPIRVRLPQKVTGRQVLLVEYDLPPGVEAIPLDVPADDAAAPPDEDAEDVDADAEGADAADPADADAADPADADPDPDEEPVPEPEPLDELVDGDSYVLQPVRVLGSNDDVELAELRGEITVAKDRMLSVNAGIEGPDAERIDVRRLDAELDIASQPDALLAFRYVEQPVTLTVVATTQEIEEVLATVVSRALVEVVVGKDDLATYRCRYKLLSSERQRLSVELPLGARIHGIRLDEPGASTELELQRDDGATAADGFEAFTVDVARSAGSDEPFQLTFLFRQPLSPKPFQSRGGLLKLSLPIIGGASAGTQQLRTIVWAPDGYGLIGRPDRFVSESHLEFEHGGVRGWFGPLRPVSSVLRGGESVDDGDKWIASSEQTTQGVFQLAKVGQPYVYTSVGGPSSITLQWWDLPFVTWVVSAAIAVIGLLLRNTTLRNKLSVIVVAAAALGAYALRDPDSALLLLHASRFGLLVLLVVWVLGELATLLTSTRDWYRSSHSTGGLQPAGASGSTGSTPTTPPSASSSTDGTESSGGSSPESGS